MFTETIKKVLYIMHNTVIFQIQEVFVVVVWLCANFTHNTNTTEKYPLMQIDM